MHACAHTRTFAHFFIFVYTNEHLKCSHVHAKFIHMILFLFQGQRAPQLVFIVVHSFQNSQGAQRTYFRLRHCNVEQQAAYWKPAMPHRYFKDMTKQKQLQNETRKVGFPMAEHALLQTET